MKKTVTLVCLLVFFTAPATAADKMPVSKVVLSTSGMAHFEHTATIDGNATLKLPVRLDQVNDLLKSLVVFDETGHISNATLPGREPLTEAFRDLPFNYQDMQSPVKLLNVLQGAEISVSGSMNTTGKLIRVIPVKVELDNGQKFTTHHRLTVLTKDGIKQGILEDLTAIKFTDTDLQNQLSAALEAIRNHSTKDLRTLNIHLKGQGKRQVNLAYVVESPLWKAAYRLVLPQSGANKPNGFVQGWAVIENMTGTDWAGVGMTLVSGNPVTYAQALYPSYRVSRPNLPVEVLGRVMPRVDQGVLEEKPAEQDASFGRTRDLKELRAAERGQGRAFADTVVSNLASAEAVAAPVAPQSMAQMAQAAQSADATTQVLFTFPDTFDLAAGHSMMLPFISSTLPMTRLSLYQPDTHATHPLAAVEFENTGNSGLPPGIITLYEKNETAGTTYVGDAQMPVLSKGEKRLISYALDTKTQINRDTKSISTEDQITISKGVMRKKLRYRQETVYTIKAPAQEDRLVVIEHPKRHNYDIESPKDGVETTATHYRVRVPLKRGTTQKQNVVLVHDSWQSVQIQDLSTSDLKAYAGTRGKLDKKTRKVFEELAQLRAHVDAVDTQLKRLEQVRSKIFQDQDRIRQNIRSLSGNSDLKTRYMKRLDDQENQVENIEEQRLKLGEEKAERLEKLKDFIFNIRL